MRRSLLAILVIAFLTAIPLLNARPSAVPEKHTRLKSEELHYDVLFRWGLINKKAGEATLLLRHGSTTYEAQLTAKSELWADRIYRVRDTLNGRMTYADFSPLMYEKIANESNERKHDVVNYDYSHAGKTVASCTRKVWKKGVKKVDEVRSMESDRLALDMLTSFYFMRTLPFENWNQGHVEIADIFSGKQKEVLSIVYQGKQDIEIDGQMRPTYHITFKFTSKGGSKTSDDMDAWIAADSSRIPLKLEGKLPVGKVHCLYVKN